MSRINFSGDKFVSQFKASWYEKGLFYIMNLTEHHFKAYFEEN